MTNVIFESYLHNVHFVSNLIFHEHGQFEKTNISTDCRCHSHRKLIIVVPLVSTNWMVTFSAVREVPCWVKVHFCYEFDFG